MSRERRLSSGDSSNRSSPGEWRSNLFTAFVDRISKRVSRKRLWEFFEIFGRVVDIFIPRKVLQDKSRFGYAFVRFKQESELINAIEKANNRFMDGWRIKVSKANPEKKGVKVKNMKSRDPLVRNQEVRKTVWNGRDNRSYRDVVIGEDRSGVVRQKLPVTEVLLMNEEGTSQGLKVSRDHGESSCPMGSSQKEVSASDEVRCLSQKNEREANQELISDVVFNQVIPDSEMEWLKFCIVGRVKDTISWEVLCNTYDSARIPCKICPLGGVSVLFRFHSLREMEAAMELFQTTSVDVLDDFNLWSRACFRSISVWVALEEVPLHIWNETFFKALTDSWGSFVNVDQNTVEKNRFDVARLLVIVDSKVKIPSVVSVTTGDVSFKIIVSLEEDLVPKSDPYSGDKVIDGDSSVENGCNEMNRHCMRKVMTMQRGTEEYSWLCMGKCETREFSLQLSKVDLVGMWDSPTNPLVDINALSTYVEDSLDERVDLNSLNQARERGSGSGFESNNVGFGVRSSPVEGNEVQEGENVLALEYRTRVMKSKRRMRRHSRNTNRLVFNE
ncbi:hypothetical protein PTKIN_Ptkin12aG0043100 [Pterospermum kingtungense]